MKRLITIWSAVLLSSYAVVPNAHGQSSTFLLVAIGNSITEHGPTASIGWWGDWGMAASTHDKDYVAALRNALVQLHKEQVVSAVRISGSGLEKNPSGFSLSTSNIELARASQLLVVQLGDNVPKESRALQDFASAYKSMLKLIRPNTGIMICIGTWWFDAKTDDLMRQACESAGGRFARLADLSTRAGMKASSQYPNGNPGVLAHPSDEGMRQIAEVILGEYKSANGR